MLFTIVVTSFPITAPTFGNPWRFAIEPCRTIHGIKYTLDVSKDCNNKISDYLTINNIGMLHKFLHIKKSVYTAKHDVHWLLTIQTKYRMAFVIFLCFNMLKFRSRLLSLPALPPTAQKVCHHRYRLSSRRHHRYKYPPCPYLPSALW